MTSIAMNHVGAACTPSDLKQILQEIKTTQKTLARINDTHSGNLEKVLLEFEDIKNVRSEVLALKKQQQEFQKKSIQRVFSAIAVIQQNKDDSARNMETQRFFLAELYTKIQNLLGSNPTIGADCIGKAADLLKETTNEEEEGGSCYLDLIDNQFLGVKTKTQHGKHIADTGLVAKATKCDMPITENLECQIEAQPPGETGDDTKTFEKLSEQTKLNEGAQNCRNPANLPLKVRLKHLRSHKDYDIIIETKKVDSLVKNCSQNLNVTDTSQTRIPKTSTRCRKLKVCKLCAKPLEFSNDSAYYRHMKHFHRQPTCKITCIHCRKKFKRPDSLKRHQTLYCNVKRSKVNINKKK